MGSIKSRSQTARVRAAVAVNQELANRAKHKDTPKNLVFPIAREVFGELSENWLIEAADCPQSCCPDYDDHG